MVEEQHQTMVKGHGLLVLDFQETN